MWVFRVYLSNNRVDVPEESSSRLHIVPHLLGTKVNLDRNNTHAMLLQHTSGKHVESILTAGDLAIGQLGLWLLYQK